MSAPRSRDDVLDDVHGRLLEVRDGLRLASREDGNDRETILYLSLRTCERLCDDVDRLCEEVEAATNASGTGNGTEVVQ